MKTNNNISNPVPMRAKTKLASDLPNAARIADAGNRRGRASISSLNRIKRSPLVGVDNRCNTRIGVVGVSPTDIPRRGLGYQPCICTNDNLLVTNSIKNQLIWLL